MWREKAPVCWGVQVTEGDAAVAVMTCGCVLDASKDGPNHTGKPRSYVFWKIADWVVPQEANQPDKLVFHLLEKAALLLTEGGGVRSN